MISLITRIQVEGNDTVSFINGTNYVQGMSQIMPQVPTYISYAYDSITITQDGSKPFQFSVYTVTEVGGNTFNTLNFQDAAAVVQAKTIEIYRLLVTSIFKGCCECGNAEPECSIQYTSGDGVDPGTLLIDGAATRINYFTANNQDFTGFWPIIQDGSWIFIFSKTDPTVYGVFQLSNYSDGGTFAQFDITLLAGTNAFPEGTELCVDVTSVGGSLVQGWQDTLIVDSVLTQDNTVDGGNFDFVFDNNNSFVINSPGGSIETDSGGSSLIAGSQSITVNVGYIDIITPDYASASTGWVLALDASGHVEYVEAGTGTISSIGLFMPPAFTVSTPNPLTSNGSFTVTGAGTDLQYIDGTGNLQTFPTYTVENGLHAFGGVPGEAPPDPFLFHLGGLLIEDTLITATNGLTEYVLGVAGTVNQDTRQPFAVSNLGLGGAAVFADYGAGFRPNPTVQMLTDNDLYQPILELTMQGNLPNLAPILANRISLLRLKYDGAPANARTAMDFSFRNNDPNPNLDWFPAVQLTAEVTNFTVNNETANLELMIFQGGSQQVKLIMEGKGQLWLNEYGANVFSDGTTNINNALTYVLSVDNLGRVWKKLSTGGGTVTSVGATGLLTTTATNPFTTSGIVTSQMASGFLVGRYSPGTGVFQQITIGDGLTLSASGELSADGGGATYDSAQGVYKNTFLANDTFELGMDSPIGAFGTIPFLTDRYVDVNTFSFNISSQASNRFRFLASGQLQMLEYNNSTAFDAASGPSVGVLNVDNAGNVFVGTGGGGTYDSDEGIYNDSDVFKLGAPSGSQAGIAFSIDRFIDTTDKSLQMEGSATILKTIQNSAAPLTTNGTFLSTASAGGSSYAGVFTGYEFAALLAYSVGVDSYALEVTNAGAGANSFAAFFQCDAGGGIQVVSSSNSTLQINGGSTVTPAIYPILYLENLSNLITPANGEGVSITMSPGTDAFSTIDVGASLNAVISDIGTPAGNDSVVDFRVDTLYFGTVQEHTSFIGDGQLRLHEYGQTPANFPDPSPVWALGVDASGNVVEFAPSGGGTTYTVNNGLTENPADNFQLGGLLIQDTVVSGSANTWDLTFDELNEFYVNGNNKMQITSTDAIGDFSQCYVAPFAAQLLNVTAGFASSTISAEAGLASMEATPVKILLNATEMQLKTPAVAASTAVNGQVLTLLDATTGEAEWANGGGGTTYTVNNGLTESPADNFQLGGTLIQDTTINGTNAYNLDFVDLQSSTNNALESYQFSTSALGNNASLSLNSLANVSRFSHEDNTTSVVSAIELVGTELRVQTPLYASKTAGDVLTLMDATTGEAEWQPAPSGGIPFAVATAFSATPNTYTTTIPGVTGYTDGDAYIIRFNTGNESGATLNINGIGAKSLHYNNAGALIGGDIWDGAEMLCIFNFLNDSFDCIGTSPNSLYAYVTNDEATSITKGQAVYAFSGVGNRMTVKLARANTDATSAQTIGIVFSTSIGANQRGIILIQGYLTGLTQFPTATWTDGDPVYLSPTTPGAFSQTKPLAPSHLVYLGVCATASNGSAGRMYVRVQNGYEMNELHDVASTGAVNNDILYRDTTVTPNLWKPASISTILGYTPQAAITGAATTITTSDLTVNRALISNASGKVAVSGSTVGYNLTTLTDPSAVRFLRINNDNTVTARTAAEMVSDLGIGSGSVSVLGQFTNGDTIPASVTRFGTLFSGSPNPNATTDVVRRTPMVTSGTLSRLYIMTNTAQPATGSLICTLRKNSVDQVMTITIAAGSAAGVFTDLVNSISVVAGDLIGMKFQNNATTVSAAILNNQALLTI